MRVLFFAQLAAATGCRECEIRCGELEADALWDQLLARYPALAGFRGSVRLARNSEYAAPDARFTDTDEVALIPPVSGG